MSNQNEWRNSYVFRHARKSQYLDAVRDAIGRAPAPDAMVYFVHTSRGTSTNDGSIGAPINNIHTALAKCRDDRDDSVVVLPGSVIALASGAAVTTSAAGVNIIGLGNMSTRPVITISSSVASFDIGGSGTFMSGFNFKSGSAATDASTAMEILKSGVTVKDCSFNVVTNSAGGVQIRVGSSATANVTIKDCLFHMTTSSLNAIALGSGQHFNLSIADNKFTGTWAQGVIHTSHLSACGSYIRISGNYSLNKSATAPCFGSIYNSGCFGYYKGNRVHSYVASCASGTAMSDVFSACNTQMGIFDNYICTGTLGCLGYIPTLQVPAVNMSQVHASA